MIKDFFKEVNFAITITDKNLKIVYMNEKAIRTFEKYGGEKLIGKNIFNCHNDNSIKIIKKLVDNNTTNTYTIIKNGIKKIIHQAPYYEQEEFSGLIEISIELPFEMLNFNRD